MAEAKKSSEKKKTTAVKKKNNTVKAAAKNKKQATAKKMTPAQNMPNKAAPAVKTETTVKQPAVATVPAQTGLWKNFFGCFKKYFTFKGRASRYEYFSFMIGMMVTAFVLGFLSAFLPVFGLIAKIYILLILIPSLAVLSRRLHDIGRNLWNGLFNWLVYAVLVGVILSCINSCLQYVEGDYAKLSAILTLCVYYIPLFGILAVIVRKFILVCRRGENKENKYGAQPALNAPAHEKSALRMIVVYFIMLAIIFAINTAASLRMKELHQTEFYQHIVSQVRHELHLLERTIHQEQKSHVSYAWLNSVYLIENNLVPANMITKNNVIISSYHTPIGIVGLDDAFILSLDYLNVTACRLTAQQQWKIPGLQMIGFNNLSDPNGPQDLTSPAQCDSCTNNLCQIFWVIR